MPVIQKLLEVPANGTIDNALAGSAFEFLRRNSVVSIGITGEAAAIQATIQSGSDVVLEESGVVVETRYPIVPDEMYYNDVGAAGDRLVIRLRNTNPSDETARVICQITPI